MTNFPSLNLAKLAWSEEVPKDWIAWFKNLPGE